VKAAPADAVARASAVLARRAAEDQAPEAVAEVEAGALASLRDVAFLGGYVPEASIMPGTPYDVRFLADRLIVSACRQALVLAEVSYDEIEDVEIGGPGLVKTGGGFIGGGFGAVGAVEGMAIAAVLNALTTRVTVKTVVRVQGAACELFFLHTTVTPEQLRIYMSRALGAIRSARAAMAPNHVQPASRPASPVEELAKLAGMLESGLLTREEFDRLKARVLSDS
jgi:hypothetical protein